MACLNFILFFHLAFFSKQKSFLQMALHLWVPSMEKSAKKKGEKNDAPTPTLHY
jgi:hypothetical protein